jgi:metal-dependent amidase/aminoacylase/carboxypeptidase family protein
MQGRDIMIAAMALCSAACSAPTPPTAREDAATPDTGTMLGRAALVLEQRRDALIAFRRDLHQYPEVAGEEDRTADRIATRLEALGLSVRRGVGGHGVVAVLEGGKPGAVVAFRADMDAMAANTPDPVAFASLIPGVRHICGHDVHSTIGVAIAEMLAPVRNELAGTYVFVFQPAEEPTTGARLMIDEGALSNPRPDAIYAYHTAPYEVGAIAYSESTLMSARDRVFATVSGGPSASAAATDLRARIAALATISSLGELQLIGADFVWVGAQPPTRNPSGHWDVTANFSLATETARQKLRTDIERIVAELQAAHPGVRIRSNYAANVAPGAINDAELTRGAVASMRAELGAAALVQVRRVSPGFSEDFGHMQAITPGAMFFLGVSNQARGWVGLPHSPNYVADEEAIFVGARAMARVMIDRAAEGRP